MKNLFAFLVVILPLLSIAQGETNDPRTGHYDVMTFDMEGQQSLSGIKIGTYIPYASVSNTTIYIKGSEENFNTINLQISFKTNSENGNGSFSGITASSAGSYTPTIQLGKNNGTGNIEIYINGFCIDPHFEVSAFAYGYNEHPEWYTGWTVDDVSNSTSDTKVAAPIINSFESVTTKGIYGDSVISNLQRANIATIGDLTTNNNTGNNASFTGRVLVGTNDFSKASSYVLAVNGDALFTKAVVKLHNNWPDYVFDSSYALPSLPAVAAYIQTNKHLPDLPSADNIAKEGIDLGNNQAVLLKKIEELTLYILAQQKQLDAIKQENQSVIERLEALEKKK